MTFSSVDEILDFAIGKEEEAAKFYAELAGTMEKPYMRTVFAEFAREEAGHKKKLLEIKSGGLLMPVAEKVVDLKITEHVTEVTPTPELDYQQALILAMKEEKAAFKLYNDLAKTAENEHLRAILLGLAQEEAKHKLQFEIEYDECFLTEN